MIKVVIILITGATSFLGLSWLIHICAKHDYSLVYQSQKRKFEIFPNKDKLKLPPGQS